jgi:hypothetical protein
MDPYIPQFSQPVRIDSVAIRKARRLWFTLLMFLAALMLLFLLAPLGEVHAGEGGMDEGSVIVYRTISKRPAVRQGYPEEPVAVNAGEAGNSVTPLSDNGLVAITTQQAAAVHASPAQGMRSLPGIAGSVVGLSPATRGLHSTVTNNTTGISAAANATRGMASQLGAAMAPLRRATPATPAVPSLPHGR